MPLYVQKAADAWESLKKNKFSGWPTKKRGGERLTPVAQPAFASDYDLSTDESVFTIGSCFARNIEEVLLDIGLNVVTGKYSVPAEEWEGRANGILNKYHPFAMQNELVWALEDGQRYPAETGIVQVAQDQWIDLHLPGVAKPVSHQRAISRRQEIDALYKQVKQCRLVMLTPGLIEAWWDKEANSYTNQTIPRSLATKYGDRFELHVLSYEEVYSALKSVVNLLNKHCPTDVRIFISVSPVPLAATFTMRDVLVANTYSKSVLRAAVEQLVAECDNVEYFPSYESISLSNLNEVFGDDYIHVKDTAVRENILRFVSALKFDLSKVDATDKKNIYVNKKQQKPLRGMVSNQIQNGVVTGWAVRNNSNEPARVRLLVNGKQLGVCECTEMRKALLERSTHATGHCGFSHKIGFALSGGDEIHVVDEESGQHLLNSPFIYQP